MSYRSSHGRFFPQSTKVSQVVKNQLCFEDAAMFFRPQHCSNPCLLVIFQILLMKIRPSGLREKPFRADQILGCAGPTDSNWPLTHHTCAIYLSIYPSIHPSIHLSIYLSIYLCYLYIYYIILYYILLYYIILYYIILYIHIK